MVNYKQTVSMNRQFNVYKEKLGLQIRSKKIAFNNIINNLSEDC